MANVTWSYGQPVILEQDTSPDPVWSYGQAKLYYEYLAEGWTGKVMGVTNPAKIMGVAVADIKKVMGVE